MKLSAQYFVNSSLPFQKRQHQMGLPIILFKTGLQQVLKHVFRDVLKSLTQGGMLPVVDTKYILLRRVILFRVYTITPGRWHSISVFTSDPLHVHQSHSAIDKDMSIVMTCIPGQEHMKNDTTHLSESEQNNACFESLLFLYTSADMCCPIYDTLIEI